MTINSANIGRFAEFFHCLSVKIDGAYYRDVHGAGNALILPAIRQVLGKLSSFSRTVPSSSSTQTIHLLKPETPAFIPPDLWPANSPNLNLLDYKIRGAMQERFRLRWESRSDAVLAQMAELFV